MRRIACITFLCALGCGDAHESFDREDPRRTSPFAGELPQHAPRPGMARGADAVALNATCVSCHTREASAWEGSRHQRADTNAAYRAAFAKEPSPFCTSCHAPEAADPRRPTEAERAMGVGCVTCHVVGESQGFAVLAAPSANDIDAPHALVTSATFATNDACAGCHQFRFPGHFGDGPQAFMQTTLDEARHFGDAADACADCHMAGGDHTFAHVRDPKWLAAALLVTTEMSSGDLRMGLSQPNPGHAFPTGDLFRRLQVVVTWHDATGALLHRDARYLARHFVASPDYHHGRKLVGDDRVAADARVIAFAAPPSARQARWSVTLQRVADVGTGEAPEAAAIESELRLHDGALPRQ